MPRESRNVSIAASAGNVEIIQRLRSANGHLQAVIGMVEAGEPCESVLYQLSAVQAALRCAGHALIQCQLEQHANSLINDPSPEMRAQIGSRLSNLYSLFTKTQTYP